MPHDATKVLMGIGYSSDRELTTETGDPAVFRAGLAVRKSAAGALLAGDSATAALIGISAGASLSDTAKTAVFRSGLRIPLLLDTSEGAQAQLVLPGMIIHAIEPGIEGNAITVEFSATHAAGAETAFLVGNAVRIGMAPGVSTALQITTAIDASAEVSALIWTSSSVPSTVQAAFAPTPLIGGSDGDVTFAKPGVALKINPDNGKAAATGDATNGVFSSGPLYGVFADGHVAAVALVDIPGGI